MGGGAPRAPRPGGAGRPPDHQQLLIRRATALGIAVLVLILLVVGINACRSSAKKNALRDYNRNIGTLATQSDTDVSKPFFGLMTNPGNRSAVNV